MNSVQVTLDPTVQTAQVDPSPFSYETTFRKSVEGIVGANINSLTALQATVNAFKSDYWGTIKSKNILVLKNTQHLINMKFFKIIEDTLILGDNHVFNMVTRFSDLASTVRGFDVLKAGDHRRIALRLFAKLNESILYGEDPSEAFKEMLDIIALKHNGFEEKLQPYKEFFEVLDELLHHFANDLNFLMKNDQREKILDTMVEYFNKVEEDADAEALA